MKYIIPLCVLAFTLSSHAYNADYPKSREEVREEEMGSILGGDGLVFHPGKIRNESTKTETKTNLYLWNAALEVLGVAPLMVKDQEGGVIITDWYSDKKQPHESHKVTVKILSNVISPESLQVEYVNRLLKNGRWLELDAKPEHVMDVEARIIKRARELYTKSGS